MRLVSVIENSIRIQKMVMKGKNQLGNQFTLDPTTQDTPEVVSATWHSSHQGVPIANAVRGV